MTELGVIDSVPVADGIVPLLEEVLARARAGQLSSVAVAYVYRDGSTGNCWSPPPTIGTLLGSVCMLTGDLQATIVSKKAPPCP